MISPRLRLLAAAWLGAVCAGCGSIPSVGPDYTPPTPAAPAEWLHAPTNGAGQPDLVGWWRRFNDPKLNELVERAVEANHSLDRAESRIREARAERNIARAGFLPSIGAAGTFTRRDPSDNIASATFSPVSEDLRSTYEAGFDASWELDIFGRVRRGYEAAAADLEAASADRSAVVVSLVGEVAREYAGVRSLRKRLRIAEQNISIQADSLAIVEARFNAGLSSELDVAQARAQLETTRANVPALTAESAAAVYRLGILLGEPPTAVEARLQGAAPTEGAPTMPTIPEISAVGTPSEVLRRRPDVARAERELAAANARIGAAVGDLFPTVDLSAAFGFASTASNVLFDEPSRTWTLIPGIRWPIVSGGRLRAAVEVQTEREKQALSRYEETVVRALAESESAFVQHREELARQRALSEAFAANTRALDLSKELYQRGLVDFLRVIDAERSTFQSEDDLARSEEGVVTAIIAIYKSLGGDPKASSGGGVTTAQAP